jgi:hypothetical protein
MIKNFKYKSTTMVLKETMNYHANHIGAIRTNKEYLNAKFNVGIYITLRRFGEYQEVDITGNTKDIREVKKELQNVVDKAEFDYQEYLVRKRSRKDKSKFKLPETSFLFKKVESKKKSNMNQFALLEGLDEAEYTGKCDGVEESSSYDIVNSVTAYDPNVSWGDMSDDE